MNLYKLDLNERIKERRRIFEETTGRDSHFIFSVIQDKFNLKPSPDIKILDFGCGEGNMVNFLSSAGFDAFGCDIKPIWQDEEHAPVDRLSIISWNPYRLPYPDNSFDLIFSTSVLEHAQNTGEVFKEIHRVLKVDGISMHYFPGKWYLPSEPHIHIPLVNYFWPECPEWWIKLWVLLRVAYIPKLAPYWKEMYQKYCEFCKNGINYMSNSYYRKLSMDIFGNNQSLMDFYIARGEGGYAKLARRLHIRKLAGWFLTNFRTNFIYQRKLNNP